MNKDMSIVSQTAGKLTAQVVQSDTAIAAVRNGTFAEIHETILSTLLDAASDAPSAPAALASVAEHPAAQSNDEAVEKILEAIPGATTEPAPLTHTPGPQVQITDQCSIEQLLEDALFHNPENWFNNTTEEKASINGGRGPDFRHKTVKDKKDFNLGVWMNSTYSTAPDWAWDKIGRLDDYKELAAAGKIS